MFGKDCIILQTEWEEYSFNLIRTTLAAILII